LEDPVAESKTGIGHTLIANERATEENGTSSLAAQTHDDSCGTASTFLHALMNFVGRCMPGKQWNSKFLMPSDELSLFVKSYFIEKTEDNCVCACTVSGCKPVSMFIKAVLIGYEEKLDFYLERVTYAFQILEMVFEAEDVSSDLIVDVLRISTFECLGCRHTCCKISAREYIIGHSRLLPQWHMDVEDLQEIHDEDKEALGTLEKIMEQVEIKLHARDCTSLEFAQSQWMPMIRQAVQEQHETSLSAVELEQMRDVGVKWETIMIPHHTKQEWHDDDADSAISLNLSRAETDEDRMSAITKAIDRICA